MIRYISEATGYTVKTVYWLLILSLAAHFFAAWNSLGFYHYDEHYQILEFAGLKAGLTTARDLAWEYREQIRPTLQPWIAYGFIKLYSLLFEYDSYTVAGFLRFLTAVMGWFTSILLCRAVLEMVSGKAQKKLLFLLSFFLWFLIFIDARFSSESWGGLFFYAAIAILLIYSLLKKSLTSAKEITLLLLAGALIGFSIVFRFQMALMLPGLGLWCIFIAKTPVRNLFILGAGVLIAILLGFVSDYFYYGNWVNTAWRYFDVNLNEGKAASFGVEPWWYYIPEFMHKAGLPLSYVIATLTAIAWYRLPKNIFTCTSIPFIILHMLISHKELRFLFPLAHAMPLFIVVGLQPFIHYFHIWKHKKMLKWLFVLFAAVLVIQNGVLLVKAASKPVIGILEPYKYVYRDAIQSQQNIDVLIPSHQDYDVLTGLPTKFYTPANINIYKYTNPSDVETHIRSAEYPVALLLRNRGKDIPHKYSHLLPEIDSVKYTMPGWLMKLNINNWVSRTSQWRVYYFKPEETQ